jgi:hypothetical protein
MVWRAQAQRDCWRAMERWGEGVVDPAQVGWRTAYQAYDRLHWARLLAAQSKSMYHPNNPSVWCTRVDECLVSTSS